MGWFKKLLGLNERDKKSSEEILTELHTKHSRIEEAGSVEGLHYTDYVERVKELKREERYPEAISLLLNLVDATEAEARAAGQGWGVAPWYYEQLAIIYRKEKRFTDEVAILERYEAQPKAPGAGPSKLADRLAKARDLAKGHNSKLVTK